MLKHRRALLIIPVAILLMAALVFKAEFADSRSSSINNSDEITIVSGDSPNISKTSLFPSDLPTPTHSVAGTSKPPVFDDMKALVLRGTYDPAWSSDTERNLNQLAISTNKISDFKATCRTLGCVISGRISLPGEDASSLSQVSRMIEKDSSLSSLDSAGDKYIEYKIASIDPMTVTFTAIGFKR